ncbi:MAG: DUF1269 domain-containing protein [Anaerolinea sp.]|nr:DUF1269 domain-containing protein [Anaerolinea sp.]HRI56380.1 DUF1269 domain-containing protein [Anaerolineae bacterium]
MSDLLVFAFDNPDGANEMIGTIQSLQKQQLIQLADAAIVVRKPDGKAKVKQLNSLVGAGALGGAFWGMLIGLLFFMPWLGLAIGAISGAIAGKFSDVGIDDNFIKEVGATIEPNHSALFLMVASMTEDKVLEALAAHKATLLRTNLSAEDEAKLRETFSGHEDAPAEA